MDDMQLESGKSDTIKAIAEEANIVVEPAKVLAVDDEEFNLEILIKHLKKSGFDAVGAKDGEEAWDYLQENPDDIDIILMDKMMPGINGVDLTRKIKADPKLRHIVIIMQTASVGTQAVVEGIEAGAYYYLTKPYAAEVLISIVTAAAREYQQQNQMLDKAQNREVVFHITRKSEFMLQSIEEARALAVHISNYTNDPAKIALGISGLLVNAVEHGNLEIGYQLKTQLLNDGTWEEEVLRRLSEPEYKDRRVRVKISREKDKLFVHIKDDGKGFDPTPYLDFDPSRITDPNGRGIAMANIMENASIEYLGSGNEVLCTIQL